MVWQRKKLKGNDLVIKITFCNCLFVSTFGFVQKKNILFNTMHLHVNNTFL